MPSVDYLNILHLLNTNTELVNNCRIEYYKRNPNFYEPVGIDHIVVHLNRKFKTKVDVRYDKKKYDWISVIIPSLVAIRRDFFYTSTGLVSDVSKLTLDNLFFLIYLSCIWVFNKKKNSALEVLVSNTVENYSVATLRTIFEYIVSRKRTIYLFLKQFLAEIYKEEQIYGIGMVLEYCDTNKFTTDYVCNLVVNDHKRFLYDIKTQQEFINGNRHKNISLEDLDSMAEKNSLIYTHHDKLVSSFSPMYMLVNGYFTIPRYFNLSVPLSIIDILWYTYKLDSFYMYLNRIEPATFSYIFRHMLPKINNLSFYAATVVRDNLKRVLIPSWKKLNLDIQQIILAETSNVFSSIEYSSNLALCRKGVQQYWTSVSKIQKGV